MKKLSFMLIGVLALVGCSRYSSNAETLYLTSRNGEKSAVPPPLTDANISHFYDLPPQTKDPRVSIVPPV